MSPELLWLAFEAIATGVAALATIGAVGVAVVTLNALRTDSRDRSRPVVLAELVIDPLFNDRIDLVVRNVGASIARDVLVTFDPSTLVIEGDERPVRFSGSIDMRYRRPIPLLGPGSMRPVGWCSS